MSTPTRSSSTEALTLVLGTLVVLATIAAWLYAKAHHIDGLGELLAFVVPVVSALLIVQRVGQVHDTARNVERQTNGELSARLEAHRAATVDEVRGILSTALRDRDLAKTAAVAQQLGAVSTRVDPPSEL